MKIIFLILILSIYSFGQENRIVRQNELSDSLDAVRASIGSGSVTLPDSTLFASDSTLQRTFSDLKYPTKVITDSLAEDVANNKYYVNVKEYGAVGDGVTDDVTFIQDAIDAVELAGGGTIFFPSGTYMISDHLYVDDDNISILGNGDNTTIKYTDDALVNGEMSPMLMVGINWDLQTGDETRVHRFSMQDITWDFNGDNNNTTPITYASCILIQFADYVYLNNVTVNNALYIATEIYDSRYMNITGCKAYNFRERTPGAGAGGLVITDRPVNNITGADYGGYSIISNNIFNDGDFVGIQVMTNGESIISNNQIMNVPYGIYTETGTYPAKDIIITGNMVDSCTQGISIGNTSGGVGAYSPNENRTIISNNIITGNGVANDKGIVTGGYNSKANNNIIHNVAYGIVHLDEFDVPLTGNIEISNNLIELFNGANGMGIGVGKTDPYGNDTCLYTMRDIKIFDNTVNADSNSRQGIEIYGNLKDVTISRNTVFNSGYSGIGVIAWGLTQRPTNVVIEGNSAFNNNQSGSAVVLYNAGIALDYGIDSVFIYNNRCYDTQSSKTQGYGIALRDSNQVVILRDNILLSNATSSTYIGSNAVVTNINNVASESGGVFAFSTNDNLLKSDSTIFSTQTDIASLASKTELGDSVDLRISTNIAGLDDVPDASTISNYIVISDEDNSGAYKAYVADLPASNAVNEAIKAKVNLESDNIIQSETYPSYKEFYDEYVLNMAEIYAFINKEDTVIIEPKMPTNVVATAGTGVTASITLTWTPPLGEYDSVEVQYSTYNGGYTTLAYVDSGTNTYVHTNQPADSTRYYRLRSWNATTYYSNLTDFVSARVLNVVTSGWYITNAGTDPNAAGTSWATAINLKYVTTAWQSRIQPGDTVWIDGGASGDSLLYTSSNANQTSDYTFIWGRSGTAPSTTVTPSGYIVITKGLEAGHNGTPVFVTDPTKRNYWRILSTNYVELSYLKFRTGDPGAITQTVANGGIYNWSSSNLRLYYNYFDYTYGLGYQSGSSGTSMYNIDIQHNTFFVGNVAANRQYTPNDALKFYYSENSTIAYNYFISYANVEYNGGWVTDTYQPPHRDFIQATRSGILGGTIDIHHNFFMTHFVDFPTDTVWNETQAIYGEYNSGTWNIYNNIFALYNDNGGHIVRFANHTLSRPLFTVNIYNNTIIHTGNQTTAYYYGFELWECDAINFKNNLYYTQYSPAFYNSYLSGKTLDMDYNQYVVKSLSTGFGSNGSFTTWKSTYGIDANSTAYVLSDANRFEMADSFSIDPLDYALVVGSSGIDDGTSLQSLFTTDYRDSSRVGVTWDIGAFELTAGGANPELISNGTFTSDASDWFGDSGQSAVAYTSGSIGGRTNTLEIEALSATNIKGQTYTLALMEVGQTYTVTYKYYIPSTNTTAVRMQSIGISSGGSGETIRTSTVTDSWITETISYSPTTYDRERLGFRLLNSTNGTTVTIGDVIYIDDVSVVKQ